MLCVSNGGFLNAFLVLQIKQQALDNHCMQYTSKVCVFFLQVSIPYRIRYDRSVQCLVYNTRHVTSLHIDGVGKKKSSIKYCCIMLFLCYTTYSALVVLLH